MSFSALRVTRPEGERRRTFRVGWLRGRRLVKTFLPLRTRTTRRFCGGSLDRTPVASTLAAQLVAGPRHCTSASRPRSAMFTRPRGTSVTGRVMPPQFHHASGRRGSLRLSTVTSSSFICPGRRPLASSSNGV